ncbi:MAG: hypothetical protein WCQ53_09010, partial [bacterium]
NTLSTNSIGQFKIDVDLLLEKRAYFSSKILPHMTEGKDYYIIKGRKSLGKSGAEKLATLYSLVATFTKDVETMESFRGMDGLVAYVCTLKRPNGEIAGQGRGAAVLKNNGNDANKTVKMAEKSSYISAVIRSTGLSDIFTSDLEDMNPVDIAPYFGGEDESDTDEQNEKDNYVEESKYATEKQKTLLRKLIDEKCSYSTKSEYLSKLNSSNLSRFDCSELISSLLPMR